MADIKPIRTVEPNEVLINRLNVMLEDAKSGEIQGMVGVVMFDDGSNSEFWVSAPKPYHTNIVSDRIIGCLERIKYQLMSGRYCVDTVDSWSSD